MIESCIVRIEREEKKEYRYDYICIETWCVIRERRSKHDDRKLRENTDEEKSRWNMVLNDSVEYEWLEEDKHSGDYK